MGTVLVPEDKYYGAQTARSLENFKIGEEKMPRELIRAFGILKAAAARANFELRPEKMTDEKFEAIVKACLEICSGELEGNFPLSVWQTGSGTQTNMNVNEVIANRANELLGEKCVHPNDDVNMSQSSNDTFPTAMHIAARVETKEKLLPAIDSLIESFEMLEEQNEGVIKIGRTHLQDATPIKFSQEISGWRAMIESSRAQIMSADAYLSALAIGGTAVGTGINTPHGFGSLASRYVSELTALDFHSEENKFHSLTSKDALVFSHGALKALAANLMKIANDIRWLSSGPRCGLCEISIPENEPGSSIMPGKVNPTQCEAVTMVAVEVMGNDAAIGFAASQGNFELNVFMPVIIYNYLQSVRLLGDVINSFNKNCVVGIRANYEKMKEGLEKSLMLVTALNTHIGYEKAAEVAKKAHKEGLTLKEACLSLGYIDGDSFDRIVDPSKMV